MIDKPLLWINCSDSINCTNCGVDQTVAVNIKVINLNWVKLNYSYRIISITNTTIMNMNLNYIDYNRQVKWTEEYEIDHSKSNTVGSWTDDSFSVFPTDNVEGDVYLSSVMVNLFYSQKGVILLDSVELLIATSS